MSYVCCVCDERWWVVIVEDIDANENDILINFFIPVAQLLFYGLSYEDKCWVPLPHILCKVDQLKSVTAAAAIHSV